MIGKLMVVAAVVWLGRSTTSTAKTRSIEHRLNAAMPRIPWPQANPGPAGNTSYGVNNGQILSGNQSYNVNTTPDAAAFNALRDSYSNTVTVINANVGWINPLCDAINVFRNDHINLIQSHNDLVTRLGNANILK